jgi:hypothetical protein
MESLQKNFSRRYETLASLLAEYLDNLLLNQGEEGSTDVSLNLTDLRARDIREWRFEEMEAVVHLLLTQLKPFISVSLHLRRNKALLLSQSRAMSTSPSSKKPINKQSHFLGLQKIMKSLTRRKQRRAKIDSKIFQLISPRRS